jgi:predicted transcriptional regulator
MEDFMKTATIPSLRVDPELRHAVEKALHNDETLSSFMEQALREQVKRRKLQNEFIARGLASRDKARQTGEYYDADDVLASLDTMLSSAKEK